jgi:predicted HicB family RNase H-like nuclease
MSDTAAAVHRFPRKLSLRVPPELPAAVEVAARAQFTSPAEYLRRAVLQALRADGIDLRDIEVEGSA